VKGTQTQGDEMDADQKMLTDLLDELDAEEILKAMDEIDENEKQG
jgi:uncharacterized membrane protein YjdF